MNRIFIGMLLVFLNFNLDLGSVRIGLIPTFLGYIFIVTGLSQLEGFSERFYKVKPFAAGMAIYTGILYAMDLLGFSAFAGAYVNFVLGIISTIVSLYISYGIIMGIKDIEVSKGQDLNSIQLFSTWKLLAVLAMIVYLLYFLPFPGLALICILVDFAVGVYYLVIFNKTKKLFYNENPAV